MNKFKSYWLEMIFVIIIIIVVILSVKNLIHNVTIVNENVMSQSSTHMETTDFCSYIENIKRLDNCTMIIAVKDVQGYYTNQDMVDELISLGFDKSGILLENTHHSFIGIWSNGEVVYQDIGGDEAITFGRLVGKQYIYVKSATWSAGNIAEIYIDDVSYAVNSRGFNIVTFDNAKKELIDSVAYDVYVEEIPVYCLIDDKVTLLKSTGERKNE